MKTVQCGIDSLRLHLAKYGLKKSRVAVLCHPSSVSKDFRHLINIAEENAKLVSLFGPQHGINCQTQDNMIEWQSFTDQKGRPVYSLYGKTRIPTQESLRDVDLLIIDLFDVGARLYTYVYTMSYMIEACAKAGVKVLVLDRPNPLGGERVEGSILDLNYKSFVGLHPIPMVHGMSIGELALFFNSRLDLQANISILKCKGWKRKLRFTETDLYWALPSPNMPSFQTAQIFPGMVFLEATSISEGRGTTRPFELIGAPFFDWDVIEREYKKLAKSLELSPVIFHRQAFIPSFHKFKDQTCLGAIQIPREPKKFLPVRHAACLLWILRALYGNKWNWSSPPYEYEFEKLPIDILAGGTDFRECIDSQSSLKKLFQKWKEDEKEFKRLREAFLLYN
ncbi:MAG: hypothetical protein COV44_00685 [Deltaproteobacteria bacterium CG11_big_fil_rev_8_21_14_0_20_45_16]|nr:MAG: hypothetical protein COV44_00685 [Deltaproteobacteria bacterium CG11_big_fil_rev_8_21_14_0_20_45_16]